MLQIQHEHNFNSLKLTNEIVAQRIPSFWVERLKLLYKIEKSSNSLLASYTTIDEYKSSLRWIVIFKNRTQWQLEIFSHSHFLLILLQAPLSITLSRFHLVLQKIWKTNYEILNWHWDSSLSDSNQQKSNRIIEKKCLQVEFRWVITSKLGHKV